MKKNITGDEWDKLRYRLGKASRNRMISFVTDLIAHKVAYLSYISNANESQESKWGYDYCLEFSALLREVKEWYQQYPGAR